MRATLLVSATATSILGLRASNRFAATNRPTDNRHRARDQEPSQIPPAHLRYPAQLRLAAGRVLARHEAEPGGEVAATLEALHGRGESLDRHCTARPAPGTLISRSPPHPAVLSHGPPLQVCNLRIEAGDLLKQKATQLADRFRQRQSRILRRRGQPTDMCRRLRGNDTELRQMAAQRIDALSALAHQKIARPEQHAPSLLFLRLHSHKAHGRPRRRLADRLRVGRVVLSPLDLRFDVDRRDQSHRIAAPADLPGQATTHIRLDRSITGSACRTASNPTGSLKRVTFLAERHPASARRPTLPFAYYLPARNNAVASQVALALDRDAR